MIRLCAAILIGWCSMVSAHEMTPTYPKLEPSFVDDIYQTTMLLFNRRIDVDYYAIEVYDKEWRPIPFAARDRLLHVKYLQRLKFDVYIMANDKRRARYICTQSKILEYDATSSSISSRICSKIEWE